MTVCVTREKRGRRPNIDPNDVRACLGAGRSVPFGSYLVALRDEAGMSRGRLASCMGRSSSYLAHLETGFCPSDRMAPAVACAMADALGVSRAALLALSRARVVTPAEATRLRTQDAPGDWELALAVVLAMEPWAQTPAAQRHGAGRAGLALLACCRMLVSRSVLDALAATPDEARPNVLAQVLTKTVEQGALPAEEAAVHQIRQATRR